MCTAGNPFLSNCNFSITFSVSFKYLKIKYNIYGFNKTSHCLENPPLLSSKCSIIRLQRRFTWSFQYSSDSVNSLIKAIFHFRANFWMANFSSYGTQNWMKFVKVGSSDFRLAICNKEKSQLHFTFYSGVEISTDQLVCHLSKKVNPWIHYNLK